MEQSVQIPLILWSLLAVILLFRKSLGSTLRLLMLLVLFSFLFFYRVEIIQAVTALDFDMQMVYETVHLGFLSMIWMWPVYLFIILIGSSESDSRLSLTVLSTVTFIFLAAELAIVLLR